MNFRKITRLLFGRTTFVVFGILSQLLFFLLLADTIRRESTPFLYVTTTVLTAAVVLRIMNEKINPSFKLAWLIPIIIFPVFGTTLYLVMKLQLGSRRVHKRLSEIIEKTSGLIGKDEGLMKALESESMGERNLADYMSRYGFYPAWKDTAAKYIPSGEEKFKLLKKELSKAKEFIFLEYFIIERGVMWDGILDILKKKADEGVEVRVMYDGTCSLVRMPAGYPKRLSKMGIKCKVFSPIRPILSTVQNNRDHRKILVIDGHTAFTGGINLADEYINKKKRFGYWKDTAIMLKGAAVNSFTLMFLQNWNIDAPKNEPEDYEKYLKSDFSGITGNLDVSGHFIPYSDSPHDDEQVSRSVYLDIISRAERYVHITTPYLVPDNETVTALQYAAKRGVETVIVIPDTPDKRYAYYLARTYFAELIGAGVKIYRYIPGFMHAKMFVSDGARAVVGSINIDFRSLYLHFECAAYCYKNSVIDDVERDFCKILRKSKQISMEEVKKYNFFGKLLGRFLRVIAPLM